MTTSLIRPLLAASVLALAACAPTGEEPASSGEVLATLDGESIQRSALDSWIRDELYADATEGKDPSALFEFEREALMRMIDERLLSAEAASRGIELAELRRQTVGAIAIQDKEVTTFYEANKARIGQASFEELAPRIREYLAQQTQAQEWGRFVRGLRDAAELDVAFEAPRVAIEAVGPAKGSAEALVTIVEFSDFNCPFCKRVNPTLEAIQERYPEQVRIVFRHFPLDRIHPRARPIAEASACADEQGRFWDFHDGVFADGSAMTDEAIRATAEGLSLDLAAFDACLSSGRGRDVVQRDAEAAAAAGVTGTPAFFVNGIRLSGAQPVEAFVRVIEQEIARDGSGEPGAS